MLQEEKVEPLTLAVSVFAAEPPQSDSNLATLAEGLSAICTFGPQSLP